MFNIYSYYFSTDPRDVLTLSEGETDLREQLLTQFNEGHKP